MATEAVKRGWREAWLPRLLAMNTTRAEAMVLRRRFTGLIRAMDDGTRDREVKIGCPHCSFVSGNGGLQCGACEYRRVFPNLRHSWGGNEYLTCIMVPFFGVRLYDLGCLRLWVSDCALLENWRREENTIRDFCEGHIEWANAVIAAKK